MHSLYERQDGCPSRSRFTEPASVRMKTLCNTAAHNTWALRQGISINNYRCKAKPVGSPPAYPTSHPVNFVLIGQLIGSPAFIESGSLFACVQQSAAVALTNLLIARRRRTSPIAMPAVPPLRMSCELQGEGRRSILPTKLVATATSLEGSILQIVHLRSKFYQSCTFREDRSSRC